MLHSSNHSRCALSPNRQSPAVDNHSQRSCTTSFAVTVLLTAVTSASQSVAEGACRVDGITQHWPTSDGRRSMSVVRPARNEKGRLREQRRNDDADKRSTVHSTRCAKRRDRRCRNWRSPPARPGSRGESRISSYRTGVSAGAVSKQTCSAAARRHVGWFRSGPHGLGCRTQQRTRHVELRHLWRRTTRRCRHRQLDRAASAGRDTCIDARCLTARWADCAVRCGGVFRC